MMATPAPGQIPTPAKPTNPFEGGGTESNIERQKALLNDIIAMGGTRGAALYQDQDSAVQEALRKRLAAAPTTDAQQGIYNAFARDARAGAAQHAATQLRQAQLGNVFMDQAKAAVPLYAAQQNSLVEQLRMQYEENARRDAEQAALSRAVSRGGGGGSARASASAPTAMPGDMNAKEAQKIGAAKPPLSIDQAFRAVGATDPRTQAGLGRAIQQVGQELKINSDLSWNEILMLVDGLVMEFADLGLVPQGGNNTAIVRDAVLAMYAPVWGVYDFIPGNYAQSGDNTPVQPGGVPSVKTTTAARSGTPNALQSALARAANPLKNAITAAAKTKK